MSALITGVCVLPLGFFSTGIKSAEGAVGRGSAAAVVPWSELDPKSVDGLHEHTPSHTTRRWAEPWAE